MNPYEMVAAGALVLAFGIPFAVYVVSRGIPQTREFSARDRERSRALPFIGNGVIPSDRDRDHSEDTGRFGAILLLLLRSWPYIRPQLLGR